MWILSSNRTLLYTYQENDIFDKWGPRFLTICYNKHTTAKDIRIV